MKSPTEFPPLHPDLNELASQVRQLAGLPVKASDYAAMDLQMDIEICRHDHGHYAGCTQAAPPRLN
jgi:hypothetical protein